MITKEKVRELLDKNYPIEFWDCYNDSPISTKYRIKDSAKCALFTVEAIIAELLDLIGQSPTVYQSLNTPKKLCTDILNPKLKSYLEVKEKLIKIIE